VIPGSRERGVPAAAHDLNGLHDGPRGSSILVAEAGYISPVGLFRTVSSSPVQ